MIISEGVQFADGAVAIYCIGSKRPVPWVNLDHALRVHDHRGDAEFEWLD